MQLGAAMPLVDIGGAPPAVRDFAQAAEALGYHHLAGTDHVIGVNVASRPGWGNRNTSADLFHDPFVLFGFLAACTARIGFSTQVLILAQRQAVLVAKQAACLDVLCEGRFRLGVGIGWNEAEFVALNENFRDRGRRSEEQVAVMQALWAEPHVTFRGRWHTVEDAGINPLPTRRAIPVWLGGHHDATLRRIARFGEGWMMLAYPPDASARAEIEKLRSYVHAEGRDPASVGIEVWVSTAAGGAAEWREEFRFWQALGVTHVTLNSTFGRYHHQRIAGRSMDAHVAALEAYRNAVADLL